MWFFDRHQGQEPPVKLDLILDANIVVVVSFLWGALAFPQDDQVKSIPLSIVALLLLIAGIGCLSMSNSEFVKKLEKSKKTQNINAEEDASSPLLTEDSPPKEIKSTDKLIGLGCALGLGYFSPLYNEFILCQDFSMGL